MDYSSNYVILLYHIDTSFSNKVALYCLKLKLKLKKNNLSNN